MISKHTLRFILALIPIAGFAVHDTAQGQKLVDYGIVLMHGKGGGPGGPIAGISGDLPPLKWSSLMYGFDHGG